MFFFLIDVYVPTSPSLWECICDEGFLTVDELVKLEVVIVIGIFIIVCNSLLVHVIRVSKSLQNGTYYLMGSLALSGIQLFSSAKRKGA